ncbi:MAG: hypothetical protein JSS49_08340 [Planctomycetes bacterium]|nr:hypothetical protein [Planctomycetota bacterium]
MNETLELTDPEHPDADEAAMATARLLIAVHEQRSRQIAKGDDGPDHEAQVGQTEVAA